MRKKAAPVLSLVTWWDAQAHHGWHTEAEVSKADLAVVETAGWIVRRGTKIVTVAQSKSGEGGDVAYINLQTIPKVWVKDIRALGADQ